MQGYSTIMFDMDGTLLDTLDDLWRSLNFALASCKLPARSHQEARSFVGNGVRSFVERALPKDATPQLARAVFAEFFRHYAAHCNDHTQPYPGVPELVGQLRADGRRLAVVSNKDEAIVRTLVQDHFPGSFGAVLGAREGRAKKPARDMVDAAALELGSAGRADVGGGRAVYVGDSEVDLLTAANAQLPCICVSWGFRPASQLARAGATCIAATPNELARMLTE